MKTNKSRSSVARAAGGGRKPRGDFAGKSSAFTTRITPELRAALDIEVGRTKKSLSQVVEQRLRDSFKEQKRLEKNLGAPHVKALAYLVAHMVQAIEAVTRQKWNEDTFSFEAVWVAVGMTLQAFRPETDDTAALAAIDDYINRTADFFKMPSVRETMSYLRSPQSLGASFANPLREYPVDLPPLDDPAEYPDEVYLMPLAARALLKRKSPK